MKSQDCIEVIRGLNIELFERFNETEVGFEYLTNGIFEAISFNGIVLWNSENETREWDEEDAYYEPIEPFIKRVFNERINSLLRLKF